MEGEIWELIDAKQIKALYEANGYLWTKADGQEGGGHHEMKK